MDSSARKQSVDKQKVFEELRDLVSDQLKAVSFKWLARHLSVPANDAKRLLFEFSEKYRSKVLSTYLVAGWTKGASPQHVVQLVDASAVADKRSKLDPVTSLHVYSIQPTAPKGASDILNHDELQTKELFTDMVKQGDANCLSDNRWSAVQCPLAKRDPNLAQGPEKTAPAAAAEEKPVSAIATAIKDAAAGKEPSAADAKANAAPEAKPASAPEAKHNSAPAKAAAAPASKPTAAKGRGGAIASMWSKAPAKKAARKPAQATVSAPAKAKAAAVDAEAFMRLNQQDAASSSGEEDEEEDAPIRRSQAPRRNALVDSDDDEDVAPAQKPSAPGAEARPGSKQPTKRKTVLDEDSDSNDDFEAPKKASGGSRYRGATPAADASVRVTTSKPAAAAEEAADEAAEDEEADPKEKKSKKPRKASTGAKRPAPGTVKLHGTATGPVRKEVERATYNEKGEEVTQMACPVRKKVERTTYNEKGEEVTEMVYDDAEPDAEPMLIDEMVTEPVPEEKPKPEPNAAASAKSRSNNSGGVKRKAGGGVDSKAAKKPAGKGKAGLGAGQRGIASFFTKK